MTRRQSSKNHEGLPSSSDAIACNANVVIGIGSPHGEDAAGWEVIHALDHLLPTSAGQTTSPVKTCKAVVPYDVLDWLESAASVHLIDASLDASPAVRRFSIQATTDGDLLLTGTDETGQDTDRRSFPQTRSRSSHQLDLGSVLQLAAALRRLPPRLVLWTISVKSSDKRQAISPGTRQRIEQCARWIVCELNPAD
jgi:Ni,Fe-hydrogenase maturation factor